MGRFELTPIGYVRGARADVEDDYWGGAESRIVLTDAVDESALEGIDTFSHVEVLFVFDRVEDARIVRGARHPRNNAAWPLTGILAQRAKNRPNRLGSTICRVVRREGGHALAARARRSRGHARGGPQARAARVPAAR
jgi:tRNA (Thr-GGU) A37 N-methylase